MRNGITMRRCSKVEHVGERWLVLNAENFFGGDGYYCKECQRTYARDYWRKQHPTSTRRTSERKAPRNEAAADLSAALAGWRRA